MNILQIMWLGMTQFICAVSAIALLLLSAIFAFRKKVDYATLTLAAAWFIVAVFDLRVLTGFYDEIHSPPHSVVTLGLAIIWAVRIPQIAALLSIPTILRIGLERKSSVALITSFVAAATCVLFALILHWTLYLIMNA
jgi:hypothetical protein